MADIKDDISRECLAKAVPCSLDRFSSATICLARVLTSSSVAVPNNEREISPINGNKDRLDFDCDDGRRFLGMSEMISSRRELRQCTVQMQIA